LTWTPGQVVGRLDRERRCGPDGVALQSGEEPR
jgi:hypothetical protein